MKKIHKSVLRSSLVMLSLLALTVAGSSVAQAQECIARGKSVMVRAEGITETVGTIDLRCSEPMGVLGFGSPDLLEITVELNTSITNRIMDDRTIFVSMEPHRTTYGTNGGVNADCMLTPWISVRLRLTLMKFDEGATLSEDGTTITWKILSSAISPGRRRCCRFSGDYRGHQSQRLHGGRWRRCHRGGECWRRGGSQRFAQNRGRDNRSESQGRGSRRSPV